MVHYSNMFFSRQFDNSPGGLVTWVIFAGYLPLASLNRNPIKVYFLTGALVFGQL